MPTNRKDLIEKIHDVWNNEISVDMCKKLVSSMKNRIEEILKAYGGPPKILILYLSY